MLFIDESLAGGLWVFVTLAVSTAIQYGLDSAKRSYAARGWHAWPVLLFDASFILIIPFVLLQTLALERFLTSSWLSLLIPYAALHFNAIAILVLVRRATRTWPDESGTLHGLTALLKRFDYMSFLTFVLGGLTIYATQVYPIIPKRLGGGIKPIVQMVLSETPKLDWNLVGGLKGEDGKTVGPVALLSETGEMFIVRHFDPSDGWTFFPDSKAHPAIGVNKKLVSAVVYVVRKM